MSQNIYKIMLLGSTPSPDARFVVVGREVRHTIMTPQEKLAEKIYEILPEKKYVYKILTE